MRSSPTRREVIVSFGAAVAGGALASFRAFAQSPAAPITKQPGVTPPGVDFQPLCLDDYEVLARERMSHAAWEYINSGSADEVTMKWNREALTRIRLELRVLVDVSRIDTSITLLGQTLPHPILLAPTASHMLVHQEGEVATARGASAAEAIMVASTVGNRSIAEVTATTNRPVWFQLYVAKERRLTQELIERAQAAGCRALCITVDLPVNYARNRAYRVDPVIPHFPYPNISIVSGPANKVNVGRKSAAFDWAELEWVRSFVKVPIFLKGILHPDDADRAAKSGVAGIIVSNHGGRALDSVPATIDALPRVADKIAGRIPVLMDSGIRRGTDVLKALALGANAVLIGRPYVYGLAVNGAEGVRHVVEILRTELEAAMALTARKKISEIDRTVIWPG